MARAIELAARATGRTSPNPLVGAVLVAGDTIVGEGFHLRAGEPHAEAVALLQAGDAARGADLYVNLEPCPHQGRTPPCAEAIIRAGVARVFAAMEDPNPKVSGRGFARLREAGVQVRVGLLAAEAGLLNEVYCTNMRTGLPYVTLKVGMSLDGKTATRTGDARWITGEASRRKVHEMRNTVDAVLVGIGTILADDPELTTRLPGADCRHPDRVVIDSHLRIPNRARVLGHRNRGRTILIAGPHAPEARVRELRELGAEVVAVDGGERRVDLRIVVERLYALGITSVLIEGGAEIAASSLDSGIVDKLVFFIAPLLIGGREAPPVIGGRGVGPLADATRLRDVRWSAMGDDIMVEGTVGRTPCSPA
jgi:diaminohydroxyphosphoribosylaminopyrimidine deaminase / 5-amino-6-(5-phosphoribosylamino)uracil reductase